MDRLARRRDIINHTQELQPFLMTMPLLAHSDHRAIQRIQCRKQRCRAVTLIVMCHGGNALFNTNDLSRGLEPAIKETSNYYLLAWKPDAESQKQRRFRQLEVKLVGRNDLTVRVRKGFFDIDPPPANASSESKKSSEKNEPSKTVPARQLRDALGAAYTQREL